MLCIRAGQICPFDETCRVPELGTCQLLSDDRSIEYSRAAPPSPKASAQSVAWMGTTWAPHVYAMTSPLLPSVRSIPEL